MAVLDRVSDMFCLGSRKHKKHKQLMTVEIKVRMDCEGCERKVRRSIEGMKGVTSVEVNPKHHKLTVEGYVEPKKVLDRVRKKTGKTAQLWPYVPYTSVLHPYSPGVYDKKAPPGYVRNVIDSDRNLAQGSSTEERLALAFSDENPNACTMM